jgi:hypothetical protein
MTKQEMRIYNKKYRKKHFKRIKKQLLKYRKTNRKKLAKQSREFYWANRIKVLKMAKKYYKNNKNKITKSNLIYRKKNKKRFLLYMKKYNAERIGLLKVEVFKHYCKGTIQCQCLKCPITYIDLLTIDHKKGDGRKHVSKSGNRLTGLRLYAWLKNHGYPVGFQVLCWSCNGAKGIKKRCPRYGKKH